ncbi:MAG: dihydrolipoamide acetyltransferase family protein [Actinomycetota bacterium]
MASILRLPGVSADADDAVIEEWVVASGSEVGADDVLAMVETDKAVVELTADEPATVHRLLVDDGTRVPVGDPIAVLLDPGEDAAAGDALLSELGLDGGAAEAEQAPAAATTEAADGPSPAVAAGDRADSATAPVEEPARAPAPVSEPSTTPAPDGDPARRFASPLVRRLAKEHGVDLDDLEGTGPGGRIVRRDLEAYLASGEPEPAATAPPPSAASAPTSDGAVEIPHSALRKAIARRLQSSVRDAPHFFMRATIDAGALVDLRAEVNDGAEQKVSLNDLIVKAVGRALLDVPEMNVVWTDEAVRRAATADVAVAVATDGGLVTPVVRSVERLTLTEVAAQVRELAGRAQEGKLRQAELEGGTFTVSNLGMFGVEEFSAIINPPHAGILAVGATRQAPTVDGDGALAVGTVLSLTLSADHRPVDGVVAARWLGRLRHLLEHPLQILT